MVYLFLKTRYVTLPRFLLIFVCIPHSHKIDVIALFLYGENYISLKGCMLPSATLQLQVILLTFVNELRFRKLFVNVAHLEPLVFISFHFCLFPPEGHPRSGNDQDYQCGSLRSCFL